MAREMKDSGIEWVGDIGFDFYMLKLKYVSIILDQFRKPVTADQRNQEGEMLYDYYGASGAIDKINDYTIDDHVMLIGEDGANLKMRNLPLMYEVNGKAWINNHAHILKPKQGMDFYYLFYVLEAIDINPYITGSAQPKLSQENLKNIWIPVPDVNIQIEIVRCIKGACMELDNVIGKTRASIEEYKKLKQVVAAQAVTKGIRGDREMKDSGVEWIGEIPEDWKVNTAFQLFTQVKNKNIDLREKNLLSLSYGKIKQKSIDTVRGLLPENFEGYNIVEKEDIVLRLTDLQNDHKSLRVGFVTERGIVTSAYCTIRVKGVNNGKYLYYYLYSFDIAKGFYGMGAGVRQGLNWDGLKKLKIILPSLEEQQEIVTYLDKKCSAIDDLIAKKEKYLFEIENYKKSLIYEYVTGKKEVLQKYQV